MKKIILFLLTLTLVISSYAQVFIKLPDDFTEKYSSIESYYKAQQEETKKREEELLAKQKAQEAEKAMNSLKDSYYSLDKYERYFPDSYKKSFGGNLELFSKEPYKEVYVVHSWECDMTVWKFSPKNKKITLLDKFEEEYKIFVSNVSSYHKIEL